MQRQASLRLLFFCGSVFLNPTSASALPDPPQSTDVVHEAGASFVSCSHLQAADLLAQTLLLEEVSTRGHFDCLARCYRNALCHLAVHVQDLGLCYLLRSRFGRNSEWSPLEYSWLRGIYSSCNILLMNPCLSGGSFQRGFCACRSGFTGVNCQVENPAECDAPWKRAYSTDATGFVSYGSSLNVINSMTPATRREYLRIMVHGARNLTSKLVMESSTFINNPGLMGGQLVSVLSQTEAWNKLDRRPIKEFFSVLGNGSVYRYNELDLNPPAHSVLSTDWFVRDSQAPNALYTFDATGTALTGLVSDVLQSVARGQAVYDCPTVAVDKSSGAVLIQKYCDQLGRSMSMIARSPIFYYNAKVNIITGVINVHRPKVDGMALVSVTQSTNAGTVFVDPCWRKATTDRLGRDSSPYLLLGSLLNGHRVRLGVDGVLWLTVLQALVSGDSVLLDTAPFLSSAMSKSWSNVSLEQRLVASLDGTLWNCSAVPYGLHLVSPASTHTAVSLQPFLDTRPWVRVFSVAGSGEVAHGSESSLVAAVTSGAPAQVGIAHRPSATASDDSFLLVLLTSLEVTSDGYVMGQASDLRQLDVPESCGRRAFLVTSLGEVKVYDFYPLTEGNHSVLNVTYLDWFVEGYRS